uniref:Uncharacterized protein n=1 Tax=Ignavibacterium album TaxID=591197 RepID=A0A7V2ZIU1_9BACT
MKTYLNISIIFLFLTSSSFGQDTEKMLKYYESVGQQKSFLIENWGEPIKIEINDYGVTVYHYKIEKADFQFSLCNQKVIGAILTLQPGQDDASSFTFYIILGVKLEKDGFEKTETTYDVKNVSIDGQTHNFVKEYEIKDQFNKGDILIRMELTRGDNYKLILKSSAVINKVEM